jgi:hypothetical protein
MHDRRRNVPVVATAGRDGIAADTPAAAPVDNQPSTCSCLSVLLPLDGEFL